MIKRETVIWCDYLLCSIHLRMLGAQGNARVRLATEKKGWYFTPEGEDLCPHHASQRREQDGQEPLFPIPGDDGDG